MSELTDELAQNHFRVAIFGSARITEDDPVHTLVFNLARLIAGAGMDLVTGGGPGLMNAASEGHFAGRKDTSLHSIGLNIRLPREQAEAAHLDIKKDFEHFSSRLDHFMALSNAFVVTPGGVGTLLELFYTWQLAQVRQIAHIPIILLGEMWLGLIEWIKQWPVEHRLINPEDLDLLYLTRNCDESFTIIEKAYEDYAKGGKDFCRHYRQYKIT